MRKIIVTVLNLVNLVLLGITFGLGSLTAATNASGNSVGTYYSLVWPSSNAYFNALNLIAFFGLCVAAALALFLLLPVKFRKFVSAGATALLIFVGVLTLLVPANYVSVSEIAPALTLQDSLIAMGVLLFVAALLTCLGAVLEFLPEKDAK